MSEQKQGIREMMHIRVFKLTGSQYFLVDCTPKLSLEEYMVQELESGYMLADVVSYSMDTIRVSTSYAPAAVKKYLEDRQGLTDLSQVNIKENI